MSRNKYVVEVQDDNTAAVVEVSPKGDRKTVKVYGDLPHADALAYTLNTFESGEAR